MTWRRPGNGPFDGISCAVCVFIYLFFIIGPAAADEQCAPQDEAKQAGLTEAYFKPPAHVPDYFADMDAISLPENGEEAYPDQLLDLYPKNHHSARQPRNLMKLELTPSEILGRNTWLMWCAGNEAFWDWLANNSYGFLDFVKLIDSRKRATRFDTVGTINEPGMRESADADQWGLWLDEPTSPEIAAYRRDLMQKIFDRIERGEKLAQGQNGYYEFPGRQDVPPPAIYGFSSGVLGLRLFPNPNFKGEARKRWDAKRYYEDKSYYDDPTLIRPYRVGMTCAFCHVSMHPLKPPANPNAPRWENISSSIGAQYLRTRAVVGNLLNKEDFVYHVLDSQPPGTIDTSLVASDNINNPNAMNAIFGLKARLMRSFKNPREELAGPQLGFPSIWPDPQNGFKILTDVPTDLQNANLNKRFVPHVLFDGADSVGAWLALERVYLNIGEYSEQWIRLHDPLLGVRHPKASTAEDRRRGRLQLPFKIEDCEQNSVYWQATKQRIGPMVQFFLRIQQMPLLDAQGSTEKRVNTTRLANGRRVFARNCICCHSSIQPESDFVPKESSDSTRYKGLIERRKRALASYEQSGQAWDHDPGQWLRDPDYQKWAAGVVESEDFWKDNYLSTDMRIPVNYIGTNSGRALATNLMTGHMWQDFSSKTNRSLPSVGSIKYFNPFTKNDELFQPRQKPEDGEPGGGGPGFYRPSTLISIWATAPYLHNNSLGLFNNDPSVKGRLEAFNDGIAKLLNLSKRLQSSSFASSEQLKKDHGLIWRTPCDTYIRIPGAVARQMILGGYLPSDVVEETRTWRWIPPVVLMTIAIGILWRSRGANWSARLRRLIGYLVGVAGIVVAIVLYLFSPSLGELKIGPIPAGTPVNLIANLDPEAPFKQQVSALGQVVDGIKEIRLHALTGEAKEAVIDNKIGPALLSISKCPDFVMDKGHYYPWFDDMTDDEKADLIELLKTF